MAESRWCPECGTKREVVDEFVTDTGDSRTVVEEYMVTVLACDHEVETQTRSYPSPLQDVGLPRAYELGAVSEGSQ